MRIVKFIKPYSPYAAGDIAGLKENEAAVVIEAKAAVPYKRNESEGQELNAEDKSLKKPVKNKMVESAPVGK